MKEINYKKMWNTLKAESGYRKAESNLFKSNQTIKDLMQSIEHREDK